MESANHCPKAVGPPLVRNRWMAAIRPARRGARRRNCGWARRGRPAHLCTSGKRAPICSSSSCVNGRPSVARECSSAPCRYAARVRSSICIRRSMSRSFLSSYARYVKAATSSSPSPRTTAGGRRRPLCFGDLARPSSGRCQGQVPRGRRASRWSTGRGCRSARARRESRHDQEPDAYGEPNEDVIARGPQRPGSRPVRFGTSRVASRCSQSSLPSS